MVYEVVDTQNISVQTQEGEKKYLIVKVAYTEESFKYTKIFELNPAATDEEITTLILEEGQSLKDSPNRREINISGVI
jgi:hypothetical protein